MKPALLLCTLALLTAGCVTNKSSPAVNTEGPRSPLANPADNTLNSPVTGPSNADQAGSSIGTSPEDNAAVGGTPVRR